MNSTASLLHILPPAMTNNSESKVTLGNRCRGRTKPKYMTVETGPKHDPTFICDVQINGTTWGTGEGKTKKEAELAAAQAAVEYGDEEDKFSTL